MMSRALATLVFAKMIEEKPTHRNLRIPPRECRFQFPIPGLLPGSRQTAKVGPTPLMHVTERFITSCVTTGQPRNQLPPRMLGVSFVRRLSPLSALVMITNPDLREGDTAE